MRFLLGADFHGGTSRYSVPVASPLGSSRLVEFQEVLGRFGHAAIETGCDYVLIPGDLFDHRHPTAAMLRVVSDFIGRMYEHEIMVLIVPGNHDGPAAIGTEETHTHGWLAALNHPGVRVYTRPTIDYFDDMTLVAFPYPHRRALDARYAELPPDERVIAAGRDLETLIRSYGDEAQQTAKRHVIFLGHLTVLGSRTASERLMRMEWDVAVGEEAFEVFDFVALGHIHKMQGIGPTAEGLLHRETHEPQPRIWYPGSPVFLDFSEAKQDKGFLLVELLDNGTGTILPVPSDPRRMVRARLDYHPADAPAPLTGLHVFRDTIVELTVTGRERPPEPWLSGIQRQFVKAGVHYLNTKVVIDSPVAIPTQEDDAIDWTDKEAMLARYLRARNLPDEPYLSAGRALIEAE